MAVNEDVSRSTSLLNVWIVHISVLSKHVQIIPQGFDILHSQLLFPILRIKKTTLELVRKGFTYREFGTQLWVRSP